MYTNTMFSLNNQVFLTRAIFLLRRKIARLKMVERRRGKVKQVFFKFFQSKMRQVSKYVSKKIDLSLSPSGLICNEIILKGDNDECLNTLQMCESLPKDLNF